MKKKAQVTIVLIFVLSLFLSSTLLTFDSYVGPTKESDELYWDSVMSFFDEFSETVFKIPEDPEDNIGGKMMKLQVTEEVIVSAFPHPKEIRKKVLRSLINSKEENQIKL